MSTEHCCYHLIRDLIVIIMNKYTRLWLKRLVSIQLINGYLPTDADEGENHRGDPQLDWTFPFSSESLIHIADQENCLKSFLYFPIALTGWWGSSPGPHRQLHKKGCCFPAICLNCRSKAWQHYSAILKVGCNHVTTWYQRCRQANL